jgi:hypothetical protein
MSSKMVVNFFFITWCHFPEDCILHGNLHANLMSHLIRQFPFVSLIFNQSSDKKKDVMTITFTGGCINQFLCHLNALYLNSVGPEKGGFLEHP